MAKKAPDQDENQPFDYFKQVEQAKKQEKPSADNLVSAIRSDMLMTSSTAPTEKSLMEKVNLKVVVGVLLALFIIILVWFLLAGPGRPILEQSLAGLLQPQGTPNQVIEPTVYQATNTPVQPTKTSLPSPTVRPSSTPTVKYVVLPTATEVEATPPPASACRDALTITLADVGQTLCVKGIIIETVERPNAFMVIFNTQPGSFYWVTYDMVWSQAKLDTCYQTSGTIEQLASSPILIFNYDNIPEVCP
ncbi:MAG: hypothetical protein C3F13_15890 [Anaerolineales bacterium]|nr:MAG: hypothetical protein C3F13_15890 [Anaerolineales bacterium]